MKLQPRLQRRLAGVVVGAAVLTAIPATGADAVAPPTVVRAVEPSEVHISGVATSTRVSVTVSTTTLKCVVATLESPRAADQEVIGGAYLAQVRGDATTWVGTVQLDSLSVARWGAHTWITYGFTQTCAEVDADTTGSITPVMAAETKRADVRANSYAGIEVRRSGGHVAVHGAVRAFDTRIGAYRAWTGQKVAIERRTSTGWATVALVRTDVHGNLDAVVAAPVGVQLRLRVGAQATVWGAYSAVRKI